MAAERLKFMNGMLTPAELSAAFSSIPADITFVDADNVVRYFSEYRIFSRPPECLDRDVLACHSEGTRPGIERMLSEFASGWRDDAFFVGEMRGREVRVEYVALRGADGRYLGCLEIAQWADALGTEAPE